MKRDQERHPRVAAALEARLSDLCRLLDAQGSEQQATPEQYASTFDYVEPGTFDQQHEGYWRYRMSEGPPCEEFRFFFHPRTYVFRAEYWFLEWDSSFTWHKYGDRRVCTSVLTVRRLWHWLIDNGAVAAASGQTRH